MRNYLVYWVGEPLPDLPFCTTGVNEGLHRRGVDSFSIWVGSDRVEVCCVSNAGATVRYVVRFRFSGGAVAWQRGGKCMPSKFIAMARQKAEMVSVDAETVDPYLFKGRPALLEYMTYAGETDDELRELSPLMVTFRDTGLSVGLKDTESGGWLWRQADSLKAALDAIEKALQCPPVRWSGGEKARGRKKPK